MDPVVRLENVESLWGLVQAMHSAWRDRDHAAPTAADELSESTAFRDLVRDVKKTLAHMPDAHEVRALCELVADVVGQHGWAGLEAAANVIDDSLSVQVEMSWRSSAFADGPTWTGNEGDLYPVQDLPKDWLQEKVGPMLVPRPSQHRETYPFRHIAEVPADCVLTFSNEVEDELRAALLNLQFVDLHRLNHTITVDHSSEYLVEPFGGGVRVTPVGSDAYLQANRVRAALLASWEAAIVVLPELSLSDQILEQVRSEHRQGLNARLEADPLDTVAATQVVVWGSRHLVDGDALSNVAAVSIGVESELSHTKFEPFVSGDHVLGVREAIARPRPAPLTVYLAGPFRFAVAICKDILTDAGRGMYRASGANVVCVPAMSPHADGFESAGLDLRDHAQAFTFVANGPADWRIGEGPSLQPPAFVIATPREGERLGPVKSTDAATQHLRVILDGNVFVRLM